MAEEPVESVTPPVHRKKKLASTSLQLSPSGISTFQQCRQRYKFQYIDKLGKKYGKPQPYFTMANHVHQTVKDFLSLRPVNLRTQAAIEEILQRNWQRYRVGFKGKDDEQRWHEKAITQVRAFVNNHDVSIIPIMQEEFMKTEVTAGVFLCGRLDRVDMQPDGSLHIVDYKTGNVPDKMNWTQLEYHALILSKRLPAPVTKASFLYMADSTLQSTDISPERLAQAHWDALTAARQIQKEKTYATTTGYWCRNCDFMPICPNESQVTPAAEGQMELWDNLTDDEGDSN
jgi:putative RecB family exonuclease